MKEKNEKVVEAKEVAQALGICVQAVYVMCQKGELPHVRAGRSYRFLRSALMKKYPGFFDASPQQVA